MIERKYQLTKEIEDGSIFLFGARQTGKSTILEQQFKNAVFFDLLDGDLKRRFRERPALLYEMLQDKPADTVVVIDEIPEVPELLNEVHRLIQKHGLRFVLCGSSARKLKRKGYNTLGGLILQQLGHIPQAGETLRWNEFLLEIVDMDGARIDKVSVTIIPAEPE